MTGMKEGAGEDPFADDAEQENQSAKTRDEIPRSSTAESVSNRSPQSRPRDTMQIPYKYRRDGVHDGRDRVPLFLQEPTKRAERDALRELEDRFNENVSLTDLREALMQVGLNHLGDVESQLEEWGYGMTFNE